MGTIWQDVRYACRGLTRNLGLTTVVIVSLALGIGANTAVFSVVYSILLRPLPVAEPNRLVSIYRSYEAGPRFTPHSYPEYVEIRDRNRAFASVAAYSQLPVGLRGTQQADIVLARLVTANFFGVLGVNAHLGRTFHVEEDRAAGAAPVVVLSYRTWQRRFAGNPGIVGQPLRINGHPFTVIGVAPQWFTDLNVALVPEVWIPLSMYNTLSHIEMAFDNRNIRFLQLVARLAPGVTAEQAQPAMETLAANLRQEHPADNRGASFTVESIDRSRVPRPLVQDAPLAGFMALLMGGVALVLVIACLNVANLLFARAVDRQGEIAVRQALGASRFRLVRQFLVEGVVLACGAAAAGFGAAVLATNWLEALQPPLPVPVHFEFTPDGSVLAFTLAVSLAALLLFALAPAIQASGLRLGAAFDRIRRLRGPASLSRVYGALVVAQVTLSFFLLVMAGLFVRSLSNAQAINPGFHTENGLAVLLNLQFAGYDEARGRVLFEQVLRRVEQLPTVRAAALANSIPFDLEQPRSRLVIDGYAPQADEQMAVVYNRVTAGYFDVMGVPLAAGRGFTERDREGAAHVVVVNETMAKKYWPGQDPIGKTIRMGDANQAQRQVVGVVKDGKYLTLNEGAQPFFYVPVLQEYTPFVYVQVRTADDPRNTIAPLLRELRSLDPNLPLNDVRTLSDQVRAPLLLARVARVALGTFGLLAFVLAVVGLYGVTVHGVRQRVREFGIRAAFGARRGDIARLVLRRVVLMAGLGIALGVALTFLAAPLLGGLLFEVSSTDMLTLAVVSAAMMLTVLVAGGVPARWAMRIEPAKALRHE